MGQSPEELKRDIEHTRANLGETLDVIGDRVSPSRIIERRKRRVRERVTSVRTTLMGYPRSAVHSAGDKLSSGGETASSMSSSVASAASSVPNMAIERTQGSPIAMGLIAFGAGALVAALLPATEPERRAGQVALENTGALQEGAKEIASQVSETARGRVQDLKDEIKDSAQEVKSEAQQSVSNVKDEASAAKENVTAQAQSQRSN